MDNLYLKMQLLNEIKEALRVKELNFELMEQLAYTGHWLLNYCNKNGIKPPNIERLVGLIQASRKIISEMYEPYKRSDENLQGDDNDGDPPPSLQDHRTGSGVTRQLTPISRTH